MPELISDLIEWLNLHPQFITIAIASLAFIESLAMVGIVVPGISLLFATAALAGGANISLVYCLLAAMAGASTGDICSFFLGRYAHPWVLDHWPFKQHPEWVVRGELFFGRYGIYSVVIGRFIGPIRPVLPFVAGMLYMPPPRFIMVNLLSSMAWAPVYVMPGYLVGNSALELSSKEQPTMDWISGELIGIAIATTLIAAVFITWLIQRRSKPMTGKTDKEAKEK
ncbi:DedA family protein [Motiliproteus sp. MSK22-1]|uniref:DedA family protein n=1 Tax=Motiliproteus sp. MSK22-1 TaxID=1897630 RepID=UPI000977A9A1|nr:DedA family protein [Motiliproteus sp. MSK22-1]OMH28457.1 hypothetical protein BGP75_21415 [Motiliproteus sp. MSK22-1]